MKRVTRGAAGAGLAILLIVSGMAAGIIFDRQVAIGFVPAANIPASATQEFQLMAQAWNIIQQEYVDRSALVAHNLTYGAISGMVDALGDTGHSRFLTPQMVQLERSETQGQLNGVGIEVQVKDGHVVVAATIDGSPAQKAGLRSGDIIETVNGKAISGMTLSQVISLVTGPPGTTVTLGVVEPGTNARREYKLTRAQITLHNVTWQQLPGTTVAHLRIAAFSQGVSKDLQGALAQINQQHMTSIVLDLRNNPGGLVDEAVGVTSQFVMTGDVLLEKDARGNITHVRVQPVGNVTKLPMVVLIDQGTASGAEITAGAIQDAKRAKLLGETTFGTGTVLTTFPLGEGSALLLAVQEWLTPSGRTIWHKGIPPDIAVTLPREATPLTPEAERNMTAEQLRASGDVQLLKGMQVVTGGR